MRYGKERWYRYAQGEPFEIIDFVNSYTEASLTLHGVINGNYHIENCRAEQFNRKPSLKTHFVRKKCYFKKSY